MLDVRAVDDRLQRLLDAVGARVGAAPVGARLVLRPVAELAARQAAHAVDLVFQNLFPLLGTDEHQGRIGGLERLDRKRVVLGKSVSVRVDLGGRRMFKKQNIHNYKTTSSIKNK